MNILFTAIGMTDPISNYRDGSMLHICRYNEIDKVYLYISAEVYYYHQMDNRYLYCIDKLSDLLGRKIETELIIRKDLEDVHIFDVFINEFRNILMDIHNKNLGDKIYLNVSSGTPAMKSALQALAAFGEIDMIPIQVSTPERKSNPHVEDKENYDVAIQWECDEDNAIDENRCTFSENFNFIDQTKKAMIKELIAKYDYVGAKALADTMADKLSDKFKDLLMGACQRYVLNYNSAKMLYRKYDIKLLNVEQSNLAAVVEYFLILDLKVRKGEYGDFLRGITPLLVDIFEMILSNSCGFNVDDYTKFNKYNGIREWDINKLEKNPYILNCLNKKYGRFSPSFIKSDNLLVIIESISDNDKLKNLCNDLRKIEENLRNRTAHEITMITDDVIEKLLGFNSKAIINKLFQAIEYTEIKINLSLMDSYDNMNKILCENI